MAVKYKNLTYEKYILKAKYNKKSMLKFTFLKRIAKKYNGFCRKSWFEVLMPNACRLELDDFKKGESCFNRINFNEATNDINQKMNFAWGILECGEVKVFPNNINELKHHGHKITSNKLVASNYVRVSQLFCRTVRKTLLKET